MPRSSRHKSHKQHKHSSKDAREHSDSDEVGNFKDKKDREEVVIRVSRDSASAEKRKLVSQSQDGKDTFNPGNGGLSEEYSASASKRRKERTDGTGVDRWNGGEVGRGGSSVVEKETKGESSRIDSEKGLKSKVSVDSKSNKSSRRHESSSEKKEVNQGLVVESEEIKRSSNSSKVESKSKSEKELSRKEVHQYKDSKDKEHGAEKNAKSQDVRSERSVDRGSGKGVVGSEGSRKQGSQSGAFVEERPTKEEVGNTDWQMQDELRNPELEKELEKRIRRRRDDSDDKDKYQDDVRDSNGRRLSTRDERQKDEKHKDDRYRDKHREDLDRDRRNRDERVRDDRSSKDHASDRSDARHTRDDNKSVENRNKKSKTQNSDHDGSPHLDDRATRYKDYRGKKRSSDDDDRSDNKPRNTKEHRYDVEKKLSSGKVELLADRGRSQSRLADVESTVSSGRRKSSPNSGSHFTKDEYRHSSKQQAELKYQDSVSEERVRVNVTPSRELTSVSGVPERASESQSMEKPKSMAKPIHKDKNHLAELTTERSPISDAQVSPMQLKEKSHSSTSIDRRHSNRTPVRRNFDVEETGHRSCGSKDARDYSANEDRGSQEWPLEKPAADEFSQGDGDTVSVSSSFNRTGHLPTSSSSVLPPPPPFRTGVDSPSVFSSFEEDNRGKSSNRYKRSGDPNVGRGQGNAWKGVPNWSTPVTNGFIPFQHGPPPGGYHAMMQQFHPPPIFGVRPSIELNPTGVPYHIPDSDRYSGHGRPFGWRNRADEACPPHLHGWDASNGGFGDESHMHGRPDWDQNRHMMSDRSWEGSTEMWKGQHSGMNMEFPSASQKEDNLSRPPVDEVWTGKPGQRSRNDRSRPGSREESIEIKISDDIPPAQDPTEAPMQIVLKKTPEPSKPLNDNSACFSHGYLSKLDISVDLTQPELYEQCMSLLDMEGNSTNGGVTKDVSTEDCWKPGVKIFNTTLSASLFPTIKDSVLQRAMTLYKKQGEEMKVKFPVSSFLGTGSKRVSTNDVEKLDPVQSIIEQKQEPVPFLKGVTKQEPLPTSPQGSEEELLPASDHDKVDEPIPDSNNEKVEDPVQTKDREITEELLPSSGEEKRADDKEPEEPIPNVCEVGEPVATLGDKESEDPIPNFCEEVGERVVTPGDKESEDPIPLIDHVEKVDSITTSNMENLEVVENHSLQHALQSIINACGNEDSTVATDGKSNCSTSSSEEKKAFSDTVCGPLGVTDSFEACEALSPKSIECKSVNLSRIHSPESTH